MIRGVQVRWLAVRALIAFMGACMGWALSWDSFLEACLLAYVAGVPAQALFDAIDIEEFTQAGSVLRAAASAEAGPEHVNGEAFARCMPAAAPPSHPLYALAQLLRRGLDAVGHASETRDDGVVICAWNVAACLAVLHPSLAASNTWHGL